MCANLDAYLKRKKDEPQVVHCKTYNFFGSSVVDMRIKLKIESYSIIISDAGIRIFNKDETRLFARYDGPQYTAPDIYYKIIMEWLEERGIKITRKELEEIVQKQIEEEKKKEEEINKLLEEEKEEKNSVVETIERRVIPEVKNDFRVAVIVRPITHKKIKKILLQGDIKRVNKYRAIGATFSVYRKELYLREGVVDATFSIWVVNPVVDIASKLDEAANEIDGALYMFVQRSVRYLDAYGEIFRVLATSGCKRHYLVFITEENKGVTEEQKEEVINKFNELKSEIVKEFTGISLEEVVLEELTEEDWSNILTEIAKESIKESREQL